MQRVNTRMDALTRKVYPKGEMLRLVKVEGALLVAPSGGRGIYIHKSKETIELLENTKVLEKRLGVKLNEALLTRIKEAI